MNARAEYHRRYYKANRERILARDKSYREANREKVSARHKLYREAHPEKQWARSKRFREKVRAGIVEQMGGCCVRCGVREGLQFDHINPSTKSERMRGPGRISNIENLSPKERCAEVEKCQLLCKPCHKVKSARDRAA